VRTLSPPWRKVLIGSWVMIAVLSVITLTLYVDNKRTKECLAGYIMQDRAATIPRLESTAETLAAIDKMVESVATARTREESRAALEQYRASRIAADGKRELSPPPKFPEGCAA
jgi:hypothetical protein